jgi:dihydroorotate dehydrogenase electron transfer subunit
LKQAKANVVANNEIMPGVYLIRLDCLQIEKAEAGQFVMVRCGEDFEYPLRRPLSIHQQDGKRFALLFNVVGKGTQWLAQCQAGDELDLLGPLGNGFNIHSDAQNLLLVAGGIGIAPLVFLAQQASSQGCQVELLLGAATAAQLYPQNLLPPKVKLITATENGSLGKKGMITDYLPDFISGVDQVFACGPVSMYQTIAKQKLATTKPVQVSLEVRMGCGLGVCYGCTVKTQNGLKQVCQDGPVFNLEDILWEELKGV